MSSEGTITQWIGQLKAGEEQALEKLRRRYWPFLVRLAQQKLSGVRPGAADEEGIASEAFWSFYRSFKAGQLPDLENRKNLFALLTIITAHKAANFRERENTDKRGGGNVQGESVLGFLVGFNADARGIEHVEDSALAPDDEAVASDLYAHYVNALPADRRDIAVQYLANRTLKEIAETQGCAVGTVRRKLENFILPQWRRMAAESVNELDEMSHGFK